MYNNFFFIFLIQFFENEVDPLHNDAIADVPEEVMQGLKDMGAMGILVPEEYEGLGLNNTQYARLSEVNEKKCTKIPGL